MAGAATHLVRDAARRSAPAVVAGTAWCLVVLALTRIAELAVFSFDPVIWSDWGRLWRACHGGGLSLGSARAQVWLLSMGLSLAVLLVPLPWVVRRGGALVEQAWAERTVLRRREHDPAPAAAVAPGPALPPLAPDHALDGASVPAPLPAPAVSATPAPDDTAGAGVADTAEADADALSVLHGLGGGSYLSPEDLSGLAPETRVIIEEAMAALGELGAAEDIDAALDQEVADLLEDEMAAEPPAAAVALPVWDRLRRQAIRTARAAAAVLGWRAAECVCLEDGTCIDLVVWGDHLVCVVEVAPAYGLYLVIPKDNSGLPAGLATAWLADGTPLPSPVLTVLERRERFIGRCASALAADGFSEAAVLPMVIAPAAAIEAEAGEQAGWRRHRVVVAGLRVGQGVEPIEIALGRPGGGTLPGHLDAELQALARAAAPAVTRAD